MKNDLDSRLEEPIFVFVMTDVHQISVDLKRKLDIDLVQRVERSLVYLEQLIKKAYGEELKATHGQAGGIGGIISGMVRDGEKIIGQIGFTKAADHMKFIEWGVRPGDNAEWPAMGKISPVRTIYQWLSLAKITTPQTFRDRAEANAKRASSHRKHPAFDKKKNAPWYSSDPQMIFAYYVALALKHKGRPALRIIDRVVRQQIAEVTKYINGQA